jgi:thiamine pyrophosphokinase
MPSLLRHVLPAENDILPGHYVPFCIGAERVGWVTGTVAGILKEYAEVSCADDGVALADGAALSGLARTLVGRGLCRWRGEAFDVRAVHGGPVLATLDRGALPVFGVLAEGVHVNGLVRAPDGIHVWVARRAAHKSLDPSKLDHIVAGGVPAGMAVRETLVKEAEEEAAIPAGLAERAVAADVFTYAFERPEGLRRDRLYCFDLELPADFRPRPLDGEVESFALWPAGRVLQALRDTDDFKFNVGVVLIALFLRLGLIEGAEAAELRGALGRLGA